MVRRNVQLNDGYAGMMMGAEEYFALGQTADRYELINGVVVMSPSPRPAHWAVVEEVLMQLREHARTMGMASGYETYAEIDLFVDDATVFKPDLSVYARARSKRMPGKLTMPPDLVLEVLSPGTRGLDLVTKREAYAKFGVREYWLIDVVSGDLIAFERNDGGYREVSSDKDSIASASIAGFVLRLAPIRAMLRDT